MIFSGSFDIIWIFSGSLLTFGSSQDLLSLSLALQLFIDLISLDILRASIVYIAFFGLVPSLGLSMPSLGLIY